jgi:aspartate kinase
VALIVQKYGGTSVGSPERIKNVAQRVAKYKIFQKEIEMLSSFSWLIKLDYMRAF